jgi:hypothetical protein
MPVRTKLTLHSGPSPKAFLSALAVSVLLFPILSFGAVQKRSQPKTPAPATYSLAEAQKVLRAIDKIEAENERPWSGPLRPVTVTESELNSYIAYRIETEKEEIMKELALKLFPKNRIEGKIHIDLRGRDIPSYIRPEMDIFFSADVLVSGGAVKIDLQRLFLGDELIPPLIIDLVIAISAKLNNQQATSINDWYELPFGIKDIKTEKGKAVFYY